MRRLFRAMTAAAEKDLTVLVEGESGTGKELVAREVARRSAPATGRSSSSTAAR